MAKSAWLRSARGGLVAAAIGGMALSNLAPARAASGGVPTHPRWWAKYQTVSSQSFRASASKTTSSVTVGANVDLSNEVGPQSETSIAIDPSNPSVIVAGSNEIDRLPMRGYYSSNGGKSWGGVDLPLPPALVRNGFDFGSDPGVAWDTKGNVYYSYIVVFFAPGGSINGTEMAVARSSDGGKTWIPTYFDLQTGSAQFDDKPMITVDTNAGSSHLNTIYVAWDNNNGKASNSNAVLVSSSSDGGATFSTPSYASLTNAGPASVIGADPFVGPDGTLHVAWADDLHGGIDVSSSTDGGATFSSPRQIAATNAVYEILVPAQSTRGALIYPACGADTSSSAYRGTLYCSWMDQTASSGADIFVSRSTDGGTTWSAGVRANDDPTGVANDQFNQWLAVDPGTGTVDLSWNDSRNDPSHLSTDVYFANSADGAHSFSANVKVTNASSNETCCGAELYDQYGDYEGIAALNGSVHPVWTDGRYDSTSLGEEVFSSTLSVK